MHHYTDAIGKTLDAALKLGFAFFFFVFVRSYGESVWLFKTDSLISQCGPCMVYSVGEIY